jgi:single-strand DNA-binding protein
VHEPLITVVGNVAAPPTLRVLANGTPVAGFRIGSTPRKQDKATGDWGDGETIWFGVTAWRSLGEHCAESLKKGDKVVVTGRLIARTWLGEDGKERSSLEIDAGSVGLELSRGCATMVKSVAPTFTQDPWASSGEVDPETGEVHAGPTPDLVPPAPSRAEVAA